MYFAGPTRVVHREYTSFGTMARRFFLGLLLLLLVGSTLHFSYFAEKNHMLMSDAFREANRSIVSVGDGSSFDPAFNNHVVHISSDLPLIPSKELSDLGFGLNFPEAIRVKRLTEYCQWIEHVRTDTEEDSEGNTHETKYYTYSKQWSSHLVNSLLFEEPASHYNPPRDPYPTNVLDADSASFGAYKLHKDIIKKMEIWRKVNWSLDAPPEQLAPAFADQSPFNYVGDGYFYSAYRRDKMESTVHWLGQLLEGSLLEVQLGKLFGACEAGDIRVRFEVSSPKEYSIVGQQSSDGTLVPYIASNGFAVGFGHKGFVPAHKMFDNELSSNKWSSVFLGRLGIIFWCFVLSFYLVRVHFEEHGSYRLWICVALCTVCFAFGTMWSIIRGLNATSVFLFCISIAGISYSFAATRTRNVNESFKKEN